MRYSFISYNCKSGLYNDREMYKEMLWYVCAVLCGSLSLTYRRILGHAPENRVGKLKTG